MRDPVAGVGGMNHFMLPESPDGKWGSARFSRRYGNFAMEELINDIAHYGGQRARLEIKVFGGARVGPDTSAIGERNARYIEDYMRAERMAPLASHLRGVRPRRIAYLPVSGRAFMAEMAGADDTIREAELGFSNVLKRAPHSGSVELF
jgi:chemotaxis protein CheD